MFKRDNRKKQVIAQINMVPFIDVMLVLLIIFMVSAPMLTQGVKVNLPKVDNSQLAVKKNDYLIISINKRGEYFFSLDHSERPTSLASIREKLQKIIKVNPKTKIYIKADQDINYGLIMELMSNIQQAGVVNIGLVTAPKGLNK